MSQQALNEDVLPVTDAIFPTAVIVSPHFSRISAQTRDGTEKELHTSLLQAIELYLKAEGWLIFQIMVLCSVHPESIFVSLNPGDVLAGR